MSVNTHVQFEDWVHHEISITELAEAMTDGQMIHMANHLWKHYKIGAQRILPKEGRTITIDGIDYKLARDGE